MFTVRGLTSLEQHVNITDIVIDKDKPVLMYNRFRIMEYGPSKDIIFEHLGFFHELSKTMCVPYSKLLDRFEEHFRERTSDYKSPIIIDLVDTTEKVRVTRKRVKKS